MATVTEQGDAPIDTFIPAITINNGDTWQGQFDVGDQGDSVWVNTWNSANEYAVTVAGLDDPLLPYSIQITDVIQSAYTVVVTIENGVAVETQDTFNQVSAVTMTPDGFVISFTPAFNQSYGITLFNPSGTPDAGYTLNVDIATPPPPPIPEIVVTDEADNIVGLATADDLNLLRGNDTIDAGDGDDSVMGAHGEDSILGGNGNDYLIGGNDNDIISGDAGNDTLLGTNGDDTASGGADNDLLNGGQGNDALAGDNGDDVLLGGKEDDNLDGGAGADTLDGGFGNDTMTGGTEADTFIVAQNYGADVIDAFENGVDVIDVTTTGIYEMAGMTISQVGVDTLIEFGGGNQLTLTNFDIANLDASDFAFAVNPTLGTIGDDMLIGDITANTLDGGEGDDRIFGMDGNDTMTGGDGKDRMDGAEGDDSMDGGDGNDRMEGGKGADVMSGGARNDYMDGGADNDVLDGGTGNDKLAGDMGDDTLEGGIGHDELSGGAGADTFVFAVVNGRDTLTDFENGIDVLDVRALGLTDITDLTIIQEGTDVLVSLDGSAGNSILLLGTDIADIDATDFLF